MSTLGRTRLRLAADTASFDAPLDVLRRATPQFWRGNDVQFELAVFFNGTLQDVSNLASLTLEIRPLGANGGPPDPSFTPLMGATISSFDNTTTLDDWNAGTKQQAVAAFTAAQSNIAAGAAWLSIFVITNDSPGRVITLCAGPIRVLEDGAGLATTPTPAADTFYTAAESDARFAPLSGGGGVEDANLILAGPSSGSAAVPTFRLLVAADIPAIAESQVTNLVSDLALKATLVSPALTGTPTAPTVATATDSTTKLATTAFVQAAIAAAGGGGSGSVTSVALSMPSFLSVSGSPITSAGTLAVSLATQSVNLVFAGPSSGSAAAPTFRSLVAGDLPTALTNNSTIAGSPPASSDNSTKIATTAWVRTYTAPIVNDGSGHYAFGGSSYLQIDDGSGGHPAYTAPLSVNGSLYAQSTYETVFENTNTTTSPDGTYTNVVAVSNTNPHADAAIRFIDDSNKERGAVGVNNSLNGYISGFVSSNVGTYLSASQDYSRYTTTHNSDAPGWLALIQEGYWTFTNGTHSAGYGIIPRLIFQPTGAIQIYDAAGQKQFEVPGQANSGESSFNLYASSAFNSSSGVSGGGAYAQYTAYSSNSNRAILAAYNSAFSYHAYPASGAAVVSDGSGGLAVMASNASGKIFFLTGGDQSSNERARIDASGNVMIGTTAQYGSSILSVNGNVAVAGGGTAILRAQAAVTSGAASSTGTLTNAPAAGNPTKWVPFDDAGTTRYIPAW